MIPLLSYTSMQILGSRDHELRSSEHLPGSIDSAASGPYYPADVNHADAFPPTRYTCTMGNEDSPHVTVVSIYSNQYEVPPLLTVPKGLGQHQGNQTQRQLDADHPTPGITQYVTGPPARALCS